MPDPLSKAVPGPVLQAARGFVLGKSHQTPPTSSRGSKSAIAVGAGGAFDAGAGAGGVETAAGTAAIDGGADADVSQLAGATFDTRSCDTLLLPPCSVESDPATGSTATLEDATLDSTTLGDAIAESCDAIADGSPS